MSRGHGIAKVACQTPHPRQCLPTVLEGSICPHSRSGFLLASCLN